MSPEQRAVIAAAEKDGVSPIERDARLIVHGMVNATRDQMRKHQQGWDKLGEQQQDVILANLTEDYNELALTIARALASARTPFVIATCKKLEVSNGNFTAIIKSDQANYNDLISRVQDKGEVVIALYERQFRDGIDDIQSDKDQRSLPLAGDDKPTKPKKAAEPKAITLTEKQIHDGRQFLVEFRKPSISGMQAQLKIGFDKAVVALELFADEGLIVRLGDDKYEMAGASQTLPVNPDLYGELTYSEVQQAVVLHATNFELAWLVSRFKIDEERASHLCLQLLDDGVIEAVVSTDLDAEPQYTVVQKLEDLNF